MRTTFFPALLVLLLAATRLSAFDASGTLLRIDAVRAMLQIHANGQDRTVAIAPDAQVLGTNGAALAAGLNSLELKSGTPVAITVQPGPNGPTVQSIRLGAAPATNATRAALSPGSPASVGFQPLTEMTAADRYKGEEGGLYGNGSNAPPPAIFAAAKKIAAAIQPLDAEGRPAKDGKIGLISISMSNATLEYSRFKQLADLCSRKSPQVAIVDCAQGGQAMAQWADPQARPWSEAERRLAAAQVSPAQVQVAWVKLANVQPTGDLAEHGRKLYSDTLAVLRNARARFPNLRIAYLGSRIYAGYASTPLNPEPYAYEGAFVVRGLIRDQVRGDAALAFDGQAARVPLLLWGPYFWADGVTPRRADGLVWNREDFAGDGTHPSNSGREKVARMLLQFFAEDPVASAWFTKK